MTGRLNTAHAKERHPVAFPGQVPGTVMHGRLVSISRRGKAVIVLPSGKHVTRPVDQVRLLFDAPRVLP